MDFNIRHTCTFCGKEAKIRASMGDLCMECYKEHFPEPSDYDLIDGPDFDHSGLKYLGRKNKSETK